MNEKYLIAIIDDTWPTDNLTDDDNLINYSDVQEYVETSDWIEQGLRVFIRALVNRATLIPEVEIIGFYRIEHYLNAINAGQIKIPNILIIDWDFGTSHKASDFLAQVLEKKEGLENIYIFSRSDNMKEITENLILPEFIDPGVSIFLYDKGKKEHEHGATLAKLVDRALRKKENVDGRTFKYENYDIKFNTSEYLDHYLDFWKIISIAGDELTFEVIKEHGLVLDQNSIEDIFNKLDFPLYIDNKEEYLFLSSTPKYEERFGTLIELNATEALKKVGIGNIERVIEKSVIKIK